MKPCFSFKFMDNDHFYSPSGQGSNAVFDLKKRFEIRDITNLNDQIQKNLMLKIKFIDQNVSFDDKGCFIGSVEFKLGDIPTVTEQDNIEPQILSVVDSLNKEKGKVEMYVVFIQQNE